jgi:hypothetical protein
MRSLETQTRPSSNWKRPYAGGNFQLYNLQMDSVFDNLRSAPRYRILLRSMNLLA